MRTEFAAAVETAGCGGYMEYRIPAVTVSERGTVFIACESRREAGNDWTECRLTVRVSRDGGRTFGKAVYPQEKIPGYEEKEKATFGNPVWIADKGRIHLIFHENYERAWHCVSEDEGMSFQAPREITGVFRRFPCAWNVCASGPGHGIVTKTGRLVVPVWLAMGKVRTDKEPGGRVKDHFPSAAGCIYSDDHGESWNAGFLTQGIENASETALAELEDGRILFNFRNERYERCRVLGIAGPSLTRLETVWTETSLPDPTCFGSMDCRDGRCYFVNCAHHDPDRVYGERIRLTLYEGTDRGSVWRPAALLDEKGGYADLAVTKDAVYVFYERGSDGIVKELILKKLLLEEEKSAADVCRVQA